jgi:hypothetical protein
MHGLPLHAILTDWSPLAIVGKLMWLAQLALIVHVFKTGRPYWWFFVLLSAPVIGGIAYVLIELVPEMRVRQVGGGGSWKPRRWRIRDLRAELEESDTVKLRLALADELLAAGDATDARATAEECLQGVFRDDPHTLARVARFRLEAGAAAEALQAIDKVNTRADRMLAQEVAILRGRALLLLGQHDAAQAALRASAPTFVGEEPRYFLALSLKESGAVAEAREIWTDIRKRFRRAGRGWRRSEKRWFKFAGERLKETAG